ncbi:hypothetical protein tb265_16040 [Gemmatimonadetes bacterium T265]|nr:hypothetical protein tb265_16040 [Gemmatimonadetes bacterium T265]
MLVAVSLMMLLGFAAVGIDFAKAYAARTRLKTVADAAAMAGAVSMIHATGAALDTAVPNAARAYAGLNYVERVALVNRNADSVLVKPVKWNFTSRTTDTTPTKFSDAGVNAIKVKAWYSTATLFARVFGKSAFALRDSTIAALGAVTSQSCLKPWAVPYSNIKATLGQNPSDTTSLTAADVTSLVNNQTLIQFKTLPNGAPGTVGGTVVAGNYYAVDFPPLMDVSGNLYSPGPQSSSGSAYKQAIAAACDDSVAVKIGDWLQTDPGNMTGPTKQGVDALCGGKDTCSPPLLITVPIYGQAAQKSGKSAVQVRYLGEFYLTGLTNGGEVVGYLTALRATGNGSFSPGVGPIMKGGMVQ